MSRRLDWYIIGAKFSGRQEGSRLLGKRQLGGHSQNTLTIVCIYQDMITFLLLKMSRDGKFLFGLDTNLKHYNIVMFFIPYL